MSHSGVPGASLLSSNPSYNPLGTAGTILADYGLPIAGSVLGAEFLGPAIAGITDLSAATAGGIGGALGGALTGGLTSGAPGAALGGLGGYFSGPGIGNALFGGAPAAVAGPGAAAGGEATAAGVPVTAMDPTAPLAAGINPAATVPYGTPLAPNNVGGFISQGVNAPSLADIGAPTTYGVAPGPTGILQSLGLSSPTQGYYPVGGGGATSGAVLPGEVNAPTAASLQQAIQGLPGAPAAGGGGQAWQAWLGNPTNIGGLGSALASTPGADVAGLGLLYSLFNQGNISQLGNLTNAAQAQISQAQALEQGNYPPALQQAISQQLQSQIAQIKSYYAGIGESGGTAEQQAIQTAQDQAIAGGANFISSGIQAANLGLGTLGDVVQINQGQAAQTGQAIAALAAALGGGGRGITLNIPGATTQ